MDKKILLVNWRKREEGFGGQESYFSDLSQILNAKVISYHSAEKIIRYNLFSDPFRIVYQGHVIDEYLKQYEKLFKPDLIIKNSGIGGFIELNTPQLIIFQDPYYSILKKMLKEKMFSMNCEHYCACMDLMRRTAKKAIKTVAVSNFMKKDMEECGIKCDKVIEEGIDIDRFMPTENKEFRKQYGLPIDKKIGIAVTKFLPQKGWGILAELINKFPDIHWIVIFTESTGAKPKLKNVTLIEGVAPKMMPLFYNISDFFINTSQVESFGLSSIEAASCGLPIIVYKTGFAWDWWDSKLGIRVDEWKTEKFENAIKNLFLPDRVKYEPRKAIIEKGFTKERMAKEWKAFIENIIKNK